MDTLNENEEPSGLGQGRERHVNYIGICHTLVDGYPYSLAHGLQKDAIQNALDARAGEKPTIVEFEFIENEIGRFLTITDKNTRGLKGKSHDAQNANVKEKDSDWLRFESFAVTKDDPNAIGARGQGKFVMLCSSSKYKMFYDTKREDGIYRLGGTQATENGCPIWPETGVWEDEKATSELAKHCGLKPLQENGTRLIIFEPKKEVLEAIKNGELKKAIQETWFRAIAEKKLEVSFIYLGHFEPINDPKITTVTQSSSAESWILGKDFNNDVIAVSTRNKYKIKRFEAYYDPNRVLNKAWQGIAIIHNGMKICVPSGNRLPTEIKEKLTGFIEFEEKLDKELRKGNNQNPNHYDLKWTSPIPRTIRTYINEQLQDFGKEKLNLFQEPTERKQKAQTEAEDWAIDMLKKHALDLKLFGARGPGNSIPPSGESSPSPSRDIGVAFKNFTVPDKNRGRRVNFGEQISFNISVFNKTNNKVKGKISLQILKYDKEINVLINKNIEITPNTRDYPIQDKVFILNIDEPQFSEKGKYEISAKLFNEAGGELHKLSKPFWVESDPPQNNAPFELIATHSEDKFAWATDGTLGGNPRLYYNTNHPEYRKVEDENNSVNRREYVLKLCLEGAIHFILSLPVDDNIENLYAPLDTGIIRNGDPAQIHEEAMKYIAQIRWNIYQGTDV